MNKVHDLLAIIRGVSGAIKIPEDLPTAGEELEVELGPNNSNKVLDLKGSKLTVNTSLSDGNLIANEVFKKAEKLTEKGERVAETEFTHLVSGAKGNTDIDEE